MHQQSFFAKYPMLMRLGLYGRDYSTLPVVCHLLYKAAKYFVDTCDRASYNGKVTLTQYCTSKLLQYPMFAEQRHEFLQAKQKTGRR